MNSKLIIIFSKKKVSSCKIVLFILYTLLQECSAISLINRCPPYQQYYQKILGYRPSFITTNERSLIYNNINNNNNGQNSKTILNLDCWTLCKDDLKCNGYVLLLNTSQCYGISKYDNQKYIFINENEKLIADNNAVYFEKICVSEVPFNYKTKLWLFTKIPGSTLAVQGRRTVNYLVDRSKCAEECLHEQNFKCLSASFTTSHRNNNNRFTDSKVTDEEQIGTCTLNAIDKTSQPDAFRISAYNEEYIENQCVEHDISNDSCSYEIYSNSKLVYTELDYAGISLKNCKEKCSSETRFYCQGVSYFDPQRGINNTKCLLHSEDTISLGPSSLIRSDSFVYMRRVNCLNVSVTCSKSEMSINYNAKNDGFIGRIYVISHSEECSIQGKGTKSTVLRIPIGINANESKCGINRAYETNKSTNMNRTLLYSYVVVQTNPIIQTQGDRVIKVGCLIDDGIKEDGTINDVILGSSLNFSNNFPSNEGSLLLNISPNIPRVAMKIVDSSQQTQINDVNLGQNLELQISLDPPNGAYDIRAVQLIAKSESGHNSILLLDNQGCPTDLKVFPQLEKIITSTSHILSGKFHAFKFADSNYVNFEVLIKFCLGTCIANSCPTTINPRTKRQAKSNMLSQNDISKSIDNYETNGNSFQLEDLFILPKDTKLQLINDLEIDTNNTSVPAVVTAAQSANPMVQQVPLQLKLNVRNLGTEDVRNLIYGEDIQYFDDLNDELDESLVCVNKTLIILVFVLWVIIQTVLLTSCCVLLNKYKRLAIMADDRSTMQRGFTNLEFENMHRRVQWADQGKSQILALT